MTSSQEDWESGGHQQHRSNYRCYWWCHGGSLGAQNRFANLTINGSRSPRRWWHGHGNWHRKGGFGAAPWCQNRQLWADSSAVRAVPGSADWSWSSVPRKMIISKCNIKGISENIKVQFLDFSTLVDNLELGWLFLAVLSWSFWFWGKFVVTATQMLDSMERAPRPTRAEATDVSRLQLKWFVCWIGQIYSNNFKYVSNEWHFMVRTFMYFLAPNLCESTGIEDLLFWTTATLIQIEPHGAGLERSSGWHGCCDAFRWDCEWQVPRTSSCHHASHLPSGREGRGLQGTALVGSDVHTWLAKCRCLKKHFSGSLPGHQNEDFGLEHHEPGTKAQQHWESSFNMVLSWFYDVFHGFSSYFLWTFSSHFEWISLGARFIPLGRILRSSPCAPLPWRRSSIQIVAYRMDESCFEMLCYLIYCWKVQFFLYNVLRL